MSAVARGLRIFVLLFAFWAALSGAFDAFHLGAGALVAAAAAVVASRRARVPAFPILRFLAYLPWLLGQILLSNLRVARLVLSPRSRIEPSFVRVAPRCQGRTALALAGCSITLTPGTVTVDAKPGLLLVHALDARSAADVRDGAVEARVERVFGGPTP